MSFPHNRHFLPHPIRWPNVVFADEIVKDDASDGHQNVEETKKEETEPTQWPGKESLSKSTAQASSSSEKRNTRFLTLNFLFCQITHSNHFPYTVETPVSTISCKQSPLCSDQFPNYQTFPCQDTI